MTISVTPNPVRAVTVTGADHSSALAELSSWVTINAATVARPVSVTFATDVTPGSVTAVLVTRLGRSSRSPSRSTP